VQLSFVSSHIKDRLTNTVLIGGFLPDTVHLPSAELSWTVAPRFEFGYRLPDGAGEILAAYRFLTTDGNGVVFEPEGTATLQSRLNVNVIDLDYASNECSLGERWDMRWKIGARLASVFFDSRADLVIAPIVFGGGFSDIHASNSFLGAGPHAGLELTRRLPLPGVSLFGKVEAASLLGQITQNFSERFCYPALNHYEIGGATHLTHSQAVPVLNAQLGVNWTPPNWQHVHFSIGYEYEHWWSLGKVGDSAAELSDQGLFLRSEFNY
jgi:hypothetical protein